MATKKVKLASDYTRELLEVKAQHVVLDDAGVNVKVEPVSDSVRVSVFREHPVSGLVTRHDGVYPKDAADAAVRVAGQAVFVESEAAFFEREVLMIPAVRRAFFKALRKDASGRESWGLDVARLEAFNVRKALKSWSYVHSYVPRVSASVRDARLCVSGFGVAAVLKK